MRNFIRTVFIILLVLSVLCGCAGKEAESPALEWKWEADPSGHWKIYENGEKSDFGEHDFNEISVCTVCGIESIEWNNGIISINAFDEEKNVTFSKNYKNGEIVAEYEIGYNEDGTERLIYSSEINPDGLKMITEYDESGRSVKAQFFYPDGTPHHESVYEYANPDGGMSFERYTDYEEKRIFEYGYDEKGDWISYTVYRLDTGSFVSGQTFEYEYDSEGRKICQRTFEKDDLREEIFFGYYEDAEGVHCYRSKYIYYIIEDFIKGHYTVTEYNKDGEEISQESYDSLGNKIG